MGRTDLVTGHCNNDWRHCVIALTIWIAWVMLPFSLLARLKLIHKVLMDIRDGRKASPFD